MQHNESIQSQQKVTSAEEYSALITSLKTAAIQYAASGLSVIPIRRDTKKPACSTWKEFERRLPTPPEINAWVFDNSPALAVVCGAVSGNLEVLDFDEKYNLDSTPLFDRWRELVDIQCSGLVDRLVAERSQSGGVHILYRCDTIGRNVKLALRPATPAESSAVNASITLIETRAEGGYVVCAPSPGYTLITGDVSSIPRIAVEERTILVECARALNQFVPKEKKVHVKGKTLKGSLRRPGDDFNYRGDISPVLEKAGWTLTYTAGDVQYWRRPGKTRGTSATFGYVPGHFFVFSSNASPFDNESAYSKFAVYTMLAHGGDYEAAAEQLRTEGYGQHKFAVAEDLLSASWEFRHNTVTGRIEYHRIGQNSFVDMDDYSFNSIRRAIVHKGCKIGAQDLHDLLQSDFSIRYDPFIEYYSTLPAWDGNTDYIGQLASTVTLKDVSLSGVFPDYLKRWLVAAAGCATNPNIVNQTCLVLVGAQGKYKTTWLEKLVPPPLSQYKVSGTIDPANKDTLIHLAECFLINLDELETLTRADLGTLKSTITMKDVRVRRPYGRVADTLVRRASFVGSIDKDKFLDDEAGTRRFLTVQVESVNCSH